MARLSASSGRLRRQALQLTPPDLAAIAARFLPPSRGFSQRLSSDFSLLGSFSLQNQTSAHQSRRPPSNWTVPWPRRLLGRAVGGNPLKIGRPWLVLATQFGLCGPERARAATAPEATRLDTRSEGHHQPGERSSSKKKKPIKVECGTWPLQFRNDVGRGSNRLTQAMLWVNEIARAKDMNDLATSNSMSGIATWRLRDIGFEDCQWLNEHPTRGGLS